MVVELLPSLYHNTHHHVEASAVTKSF